MNESLYRCLIQLGEIAEEIELLCTFGRPPGTSLEWCALDKAAWRLTRLTRAAIGQQEEAARLEAEEALPL